MVRFSFRKKLLEGENVLFKPTMLANAHGRLLGVLRYKPGGGALVRSNPTDALGLDGTTQALFEGHSQPKTDLKVSSQSD